MRNCEHRSQERDGFCGSNFPARRSKPSCPTKSGQKFIRASPNWCSRITHDADLRQHAPPSPSASPVIFANCSARKMSRRIMEVCRRKLRLDAENRLKRGELKALVATSSLELGIDIGSVELVCQLGPTRSIATCLQRVGRAEQSSRRLAERPLISATRATETRGMRRHASMHPSTGELDILLIPEKPIDVLAQQNRRLRRRRKIGWRKNYFSLVRGAYPYRDLTREEFSRGHTGCSPKVFSTKRGGRAALIHLDAVQPSHPWTSRLAPACAHEWRRDSDNGDYRVVLEPAQTFIGTVNEDFAVESLAGDIFQLGNASWKIIQIGPGVVRVEDAHGQPPGIPFWLGEAPARTAELSRAISKLREQVEKKIFRIIRTKFRKRKNCFRARRLVCRRNFDFRFRRAAIGRLLFSPLTKLLAHCHYKNKIVMERFFDESGGMQLVIHSPFGARLKSRVGSGVAQTFLPFVQF